LWIDIVVLTRTVDSKPIATIGEYFASKFCNRGFGEALPSAHFLDELDGDLVEEL
jgi:hypothetical protein